MSHTLRLPVVQCGGRQAPKLRAVTREVRLVGVAEFRSEIGEMPSAGLRSSGGTKESLEANDTGQRARRVPGCTGCSYARSPSLILCTHKHITYGASESGGGSSA